jgi:hypothetical protein
MKYFAVIAQDSIENRFPFPTAQLFPHQHFRGADLMWIGEFELHVLSDFSAR